MVNFIVTFFLFLSLLPIIRFIFSGSSWDKNDPDKDVSLDVLDLKDLP